MASKERIKSLLKVYWVTKINVHINIWLRLHQLLFGAICNETLKIRQRFNMFDSIQKVRRMDECNICSLISNVNIEWTYINFFVYIALKKKYKIRASKTIFSPFSYAPFCKCLGCFFLRDIELSFCGSCDYQIQLNARNAMKLIPQGVHWNTIKCIWEIYNFVNSINSN